LYGIKRQQHYLKNPHQVHLNIELPFCYFFSDLVDRRGLPGSVYKISRCDKTSIQRHNNRRHKGRSNIVPFYTQSPGLEVARQNVLKYEARKLEQKKVCPQTESLITPKIGDAGATDTTSFESPEDSITGSRETSQSPCSTNEDELDNATSTPEKPKKATQHQLATKQRQSTLNFTTNNNNAQTVHPPTSLESKIDNLVSQFQDFKVDIGKKINQQQKERQRPSSILSSICAETISEVSKLMESWSNIKNVVELTEKYTEIVFFGGGSEEFSVLRCQTCFDYINQNSSKLLDEDPVVTARKGIGKYVQFYKIHVTFLV
jgi:hypothetical protein